MCSRKKTSRGLRRHFVGRSATSWTPCGEPWPRLKRHIAAKRRHTARVLGVIPDKIWKLGHSEDYVQHRHEYLVALSKNKLRESAERKCSGERKGDLRWPERQPSQQHRWMLKVALAIRIPIAVYPEPRYAEVVAFVPNLGQGWETLVKGLTSPPSPRIVSD